MKKIQLFQNPGKSRKVFKHIFFKSIFNNFKKYRDNNQNLVFCGSPSEKIVIM